MMPNLSCLSAGSPPKPAPGKCSWLARVLAVAAIAGVVGPWASSSRAAANPFRGLWVGQVTLSHVNEVSIPLDENNVPIAPDPKVPTPTADSANLRLILHVNGAGQVRLLKDCAILSRVPSFASSGNTAVPFELKKKPESLTYIDPILKSESDIALVTDERLYAEFPAQPAVRIASAVFDFGDGKALQAVQAVLDATVEAVAQSVATSTADFRSSSVQDSAREAAITAGKNAGDQIIAHADAAEAFHRFRTNRLSSTKVTAIAIANPPTSAPEYALAAADAATLRDDSFYRDERGIQMLAAVVTAASTASTDESKTEAAQRAAAAFADLENEYQRFLAGKTFGDLITGGAGAAGTAAIAPGATLASIRNAVNGHTNVAAARSIALSLDANNPYSDRRSAAAVDIVVSNMVASAASFLGGDPETAETVSTASLSAARTALVQSVDRFVVPVVPTADYSAFIASSAFVGSAGAAARAAAAATVLERSVNILADLDSLRRIARDAATDALRKVGQDALGLAARVRQTEVAMAGVFGPGQGDARLTFDIARSGGTALGPAALEGDFVLAANHVTNPFLHRRHSEHRIGLDIKRRIRLDFDAAPADALAPPGFGVERITGTYREEIKGLHKPLGPAGQDIGLRVEGRFQLNRISLNDALNAR